MILAFGLDQPPAPGQHGTDFLSDPHRLNVALTRAQRKLVLVANRQVLASVPVLRELVRHCERLYGGSGGVVRVTAPSS
jgi:DNA replication ATP-dependent helicase Dna2